MRRRFMLTTFAGMLLIGCGTGEESTGVPVSADLRALTPGYTRIDVGMQDAWAINDKGMVVGNIKGLGAWWYNGTRRALPAPAGPWGNYFASNISEDGRIVGASYYLGKYRALYWDSPTAAPIDLGELGSSAQALDVNSKGIVVGVARAPNAGNEWHAVIVKPGGTMVDINPPGYLTSSAVRINDNGVIVGFADMTTPAYHRDAIRWETDGTITILQSTANSINSGASGLNTMGDASGQNPSFGPTVWFDQGGVQFFPSTLGARNARGLNDKYRMVGWYIDPNGYAKPWTSLKGVEMTLPVAPTEGGNAADVNSCGWIVGWSHFGTRMAGTLWKPSNCD